MPGTRDGPARATPPALPSRPRTSRSCSRSGTASTTPRTATTSTSRRLDLAPITAAGIAHTASLKAAVAATRKDGKEPTPEALAEIDAAFAREQEAGVLLSLATGARILTLTVADWAALQDETA